MAGVDLLLQGAIYARLTGDATLQDLIGARVYDEIPEVGAPGFGWPYVAFAEVRLMPFDTDAIRGARVSVMLNVFDRDEGGGTVRCKQVMQRLRDLLRDREDMVLAGHKVVRALLLDDRARFDADNRSAVGSMRLEYLTDPI